MTGLPQTRMMATVEYWVDPNDSGTTLWEGWVMLLPGGVVLCHPRDASEPEDPTGHAQLLPWHKIETVRWNDFDSDPATGGPRTADVTPDGRWLVTWEIDIESADTPVEAARQAWAHMRRSDTTATVFKVTGANGTTEVDLTEEGA